MGVPLNGASVGGGGMAKAHSIVAESGGATPRSILRLMLVALVLALGFDALSTALVWDLVRVLPGTAKRAPVHAVRPADVREPGRPVGTPAAPVEGAAP
jgi:hypothetical protein